MMPDDVYQPNRESLKHAAYDANRRAMDLFVKSGRRVPSAEYEAWCASSRRMNDVWFDLSAEPERR